MALGSYSWQQVGWSLEMQDDSSIGNDQSPTFGSKSCKSCECFPKVTIGWWYYTSRVCKVVALLMTRHCPIACAHWKTMKRHSVSWATTFWLHSRPRSIGLWKSWWVRVPTTLRISPWRLIGFGHWETVLETLFNIEIYSIQKYLKSIGHYNSFENTERIPKVVSLFSIYAVLLCFLFRIFSSLEQFNNGQQGVHETYNPGLFLCCTGVLALAD